MFDRSDGTGANWRLMLESLYRVGFQLTDGRLAGDAKDALMRQVYEEAEVQLTGGYADGSGPEDVQPGGLDFAPLGVSGPTMPPRSRPPK